MNTAICRAIREYRLIKLRYDWGLRTVEPHSYGRNHKGHDLLRCYQIAGVSKSGNPIEWKILRLDGVTNLHVLDKHFVQPRPKYERGDKALNAQIYCEL